MPQESTADMVRNGRRPARLWSSVTRWRSKRSRPQRSHTSQRARPSGPLWSPLAALVATIVIGRRASTLDSGGAGHRSARVITRSGGANALPVLIDVLREHRCLKHAKARQFIDWDLDCVSMTQICGFGGLPLDVRDDIRDLAWFDDQLGVLVAHEIVEVAPISTFGGAVQTTGIGFGRHTSGTATACENGGWRSGSLAGLLRESKNAVIARNPPKKAREKLTDSVVASKR